MNIHSHFHIFIAVVMLAAFGHPPPALADAARELSRVVGYTIVDAATFKEMLESSTGDKYIKLDNGATFKITGVFLTPLPLTEVVIFAKAPTQEMIDKFGGKLPKEQLYLYKLLIGDDVVDATYAK